jgi:DNA-binding response OmpR family regulator
MKHILVVDDEPRIAEIARDYLERAGFRLTTAGNGADALAIARTKRPDLIVLDLGLPQMDGLDVMRALRKQSNVPIIMLNGCRAAPAHKPPPSADLTGSRVAIAAPIAPSTAATIITR